MSQTGEPKPMRIRRVAQVERNRTGGMSRTMFLTGDELERLGHSVDYWFLEDLPVAVPPQLWRFATPWKLRRKRPSRASPDVTNAALGLLTLHFNSSSITSKRASAAGGSTPATASSFGPSACMLKSST